MNVNFKGVGLGSGYVSPEDSLLSWADYLHNWVRLYMFEEIFCIAL